MNFIHEQSDWENGQQFIIKGIAVWDRVRPETNITIVEGGIGAPFVTINIVTEPGQRIDSSFRFYTVGRSIDKIPKNLQDFYETRFNTASEE